MAQCTDARNECREGAHPGDWSLANLFDWFVTPESRDPHKPNPEGFFDLRTMGTHCPHPELDARHEQSKPRPQQLSVAHCLGHGIARMRPEYVHQYQFGENRGFLQAAHRARSPQKKAFACSSASYPGEYQFMIGLSSGFSAC